MQPKSKVEKTRKKSGGRKLGTPNKTTAEIKDIIRQVLSTNADALSYDLSLLKPHQRIEALLKLMSFCIPKPAQTIQPPSDEKIEVVFVQGKTIL